MATIINNPDRDSSSGMGWIVGIIVLVIVLALFFVYGLPAMRGTTKSSTSGTSASGQVSVPSTGGSASGSYSTNGN
ncbi:MAG TPA: hypothetical protein VHQ20_00390 [Patescibacteria group bacterium]|jgi:hypothetical protein|nr:hypothetical protein [Patescibacteria group bacterium]